MKKWISAILALCLVATALTGCGGSGNSSTAFDTSKTINVVSREDGSGTRGAFIELFGIEEKNAEGKKVDNTTEKAAITNSTSVMMTTIAGDAHGIGYISVGSMNDTVKALKVDGVDATADNVKNGTYKIARPFNIATKGDVPEAAQDFINYIMSTEGQAVVTKNGYVSIADATSYTSKKPSGTITVAGSSSVSPVMEKLKEAYKAVNPNATIEIQTSDSTTGMTSVKDGICQIGMASRELKDSEKDAGIKATVIAMDGIAVVVNPANTMTTITSQQVKSIFTGTTTLWSDLVK